MVNKDALIGDIYAAATAGGDWSPVFSAFREAFHGFTAVYARPYAAPQGLQVLLTDLDPNFVRSYNQHNKARNVWATSPLNQAAPLVRSEQMIRSVELGRTEFYGKWLRPQGLRHALTSPLSCRGNKSINLGLVRSGRRGAYTGEDVRLLAELLPHLRRAIEIGTRLEHKALADDASVEAICASGIALVVVNEAGKIVTATKRSEAILEGQTILSVRGGRLTCVGSSDARRLRDAIMTATAANTAAGEILSLSDDEGRRVSVAISPITGQRLTQDERLCAVLISARTGDGISLDALRALFDLTPTEARVARALCDGRLASDYARESGVTIATVKTHLGSLFSKMGVNRQADVVRLVLADPILHQACT